LNVGDWVTADVAQKVKDGHTLEWDPPHGLSSVRRWTCTTCGDAVLDSGTVIYGGATERTCEEGMASWIGAS
jgi:hypothetical protein